jgi:hypothetical protein
MKNLRASLNKLNWRISGRIFGFGTSPAADWKIIFVSTLLLAVSVIALSTFIFIKIDKGEIFVVEKSTEEKGKTLNIPLLKEIVTYYQGKAREFERIKGLVVPAVDPSL